MPEEKKKQGGELFIVDNSDADWEVKRYLELVAVNLALTDAEFVGLLDSLADFADYIPGFKMKYR